MGYQNVYRVMQTKQKKRLRDLLLELCIIDRSKLWFVFSRTGLRVGYQNVYKFRYIFSNKLNTAYIK